MTAAGDTSHSFPIGEGADLRQYCQLRIVKTNKSAFCYFDALLVGEFPLGPDPVRAAVYASGVPVAVEMVRSTRI
jgi:hypothetical protein